MPEIRFYHLVSTPLDRALPQLLERALAGGFRSVVKVADEHAASVINTLLWTYNASSFLPHGSKQDGDPTQQPIFITEGEENPNEATLLAVTDGSQPANIGDYARVLDLFHENEKEAARTRWAAYKDAGYDLQYWQQTESGGWEQKA